jgi:hypothetical protein
LADMAKPVLYLKTNAICHVSHHEMGQAYTGLILTECK